ncbi:ribose-phosphate pyrophosphokinase [Mycoplasmopsis agassizii]|uniref:Ribose-phosphate pyrophosphokinase n=1 Tax=Mycoplasmopsis agassizii TaxID=33922 RepID=A0ABX4H4I2_9BACT|nr:ribose-phosphate pyrophosphokinase [Mycoplasmopsis agassizii]PAF54804.1 ribose-phosphate pyrophosphokinase [Mycoplasmopsis agassizii]SMC19287.1 ribose-phosphate pyrophosphokinase [Mycoplasmopsis agassizii]
MPNKNFLLFALPGTEHLANRVCSCLNTNLAETEYTRFADGEVLIKSKATVRNLDVYVVVSTSLSVNDRLMELLIFVDSLKRASAKSITVIFTYFGYARQDRKSKGREPITAKLVANLLESAGVTKVVAVDLHNPSIQGFFDVPVDDLRAHYVLSSELASRKERFTIVSPDYGGTVRARLTAELISNDIQIAIVDKRRTGVNKTEVLGLIGDVQGKNVVIVDDIIDTGGTIIKAAETLKKYGAKKIIVAASHGIFTKGFEIFENSEVVDEVIITDSIRQEKMFKQFKKLTIISLADFISQVIVAMTENRSISDIYKKLRDGVINDI